jgi:hypothetical protein
MSDPSSAPPPQPTAPPEPSEPEGSIPARHEHLLELEAGGKGWKRRRTVDYLKISPAGMALHHDGMLREPLILPLGAIAVAAAEPGSARALPNEGRFPILRRIAGTKVVPREEGVEGWLWTTSGGSAFLSLCEDDEAPNVALVFAHPLGEDQVNRTFEPACVATVAARSPLGKPAVYGLLMRVTDQLHAANTFRKFNIANPLTDKEVPPTLRRALPTDVSADPTVRFNSDARASHSVAPPGLA